MKKDPLVYVDDIKDGIMAIRTYTQGMTKAEFEADPKTQDAVFRRIEIIGEAAKRLSEAFMDRYPQIPWYKMVGMRNRLAHDYDYIDLDIIWDIVEKWLPELERQLQAL